MTSMQGTMSNFKEKFRVRPMNRIIMIQTDKPVYKPGQTSENTHTHTHIYILILKLVHTLAFFLVLGRVIVLTSSRLTAASGKVTVQIRVSGVGRRSISGVRREIFRIPKTL